ncbi:MAG TPA: quinol:electron acceptor oxidoreductase subunit ActD, partial [Magnetovibrio sp.]
KPIAAKTRRVLGLFGDFDEAFDVIAGIRRYKVPGLTVDDVTLKSPIEHPEIEDVLGERPTDIPKWAFWGGLFGLVFGFFFLAGAQANFLVQPQGGKPVITIPSNVVLAYEMMILFGVLSTLVGFIIGARLMRRAGGLYDTAISVDQIGIVIEVTEDQMQPLHDLFARHNVIEVREEALS